jgi:hypothetical protein
VSVAVALATANAQSETALGKLGRATLRSLLSPIQQFHTQSHPSEWHILRLEHGQGGPIVPTQKRYQLFMGHICVNAPVDSVPYGTSVIPSNRLEYLTRVARKTLAQVPGNVLEVGVYKAGSLLPLARAVSEICPEFSAHGIDTFTGHPYSDGHPIHPAGKYGDVDFNELRRFLGTTQLADYIKLHQGRVEDILLALDLPSFSFVHIDCDLYLPIKYCARQLPKFLNKGAVMYFDDFGHEHCPGATKAIKEIYTKEVFNEVLIQEDDTKWSCFVKF